MERARHYRRRQRSGAVEGMHDEDTGVVRDEFVPAFPIDAWLFSLQSVCTLGSLRVWQPPTASPGFRLS